MSPKLLEGLWQSAILSRSGTSQPKVPTTNWLLFRQALLQHPKPRVPVIQDFWVRRTTLSVTTTLKISVQPDTLFLPHHLLIPCDCPRQVATLVIPVWDHNVVPALKPEKTPFCEPRNMRKCSSHVIPNIPEPQKSMHGIPSGCSGLHPCGED